jgi:hypothetical protein
VNLLDVLFTILLIPLLLILSPVGSAKIVVSVAPRRILIELRKIDLSLTTNAEFSIHAARLTNPHHLSQEAG